MSANFFDALIIGVLILPAYYFLAYTTGIAMFLRQSDSRWIMALACVPFLSYVVPPLMAFYLGFSTIYIATSFASGIMVSVVFYFVKSPGKKSAKRKRPSSQYLN